MNAQPPPSTFLTLNSPYDAAVQLFYKLPGRYRLVRKTHHTHIVEGTGLAFENLIVPSLGTSKVTLRGSTDRQYEMEILQTTTIHLRTSDNRHATKVEKRAFRIANGQWSLWDAYTNVGGFDVVRPSKVADLMLGEIPAPERLGPSEGDVVQKAGLEGGPWLDGHGVYLVAMCIWVRKQPCWQMMLQLDRQRGAVSEECGDEFWPLGGEGEGEAAREA
ncbi:hypothetical protein BDR22DRAFT_845230 [Usnea florida]